MLYFAIGDVHGEAAKLATLHDAILDRIAVERIPARIIHLGDYVDRGPDSRAVIERIMALEAMFAGSPRIEIISLMGNHERMMLNAYDSDSDPDMWWTQGGSETADSYAGGTGLAGADWRNSIPATHMNWLRALPSIYRDQDRRLVFVHAGIDPARFPMCPEQVRLWTRSERFFDHKQWPSRTELRDLLVIHGHTPKSFVPEALDHRINIDTGACFGGPLTAVVLKPGEEPEFIQAGYRQE
jgi:serine/threonine protein phosphatase 1